MPAAPIGHFCWPELFTPDLAAAKAFYGRLFGWTFADVPSAAGNYTLAFVREDQVAGALQAPSSLGPPRWNSYVQVAGADALAARAKALGGTVLGGPFDVPDVGRMAFLQDPGGAPFALWQSGRHPGATRFGEPGCLCWTELATRDLEGAKAFYASLFGWRLETKTEDGVAYTEIHAGAEPMGGVRLMEGPPWVGVPSHWTPYFAVADCDASAREADAAGGSVRLPPMDIPKVGRFAGITDPGGATFRIFTPAPGRP